MLEAERLRRLMEVGRGLVSNLELEAVLNRLVEVARELTGAQYARLSGSSMTSGVSSNASSQWASTTSCARPSASYHVAAAFWAS